MKKYVSIAKEDYKKALSDYICVVVFEKNDGTLRRLICTTHSSVLPKKQLVEDAPVRTRKEPENVVCAFDIEKNEWRSFCLDRVLQFKKKQKLLTK